MALMNRSLQPDVDTLFLMADDKYSYLKSSLVKQVAQMGSDEDLKGMVPTQVLRRLKEKFGG
jgi:pantetheine-phosphate adenylyltransferase